MDKWYALRVVSGKEKKVKEYLDKEIEKYDFLKNSIKNVILPMEKVYRIRKGKKYSSDRNFYPGYLLVEGNINGEVIHKIEDSPNVMHFLKDKKTPIPIRESEMKRILNKVDKIKEQTEFDVPYIVGESVQIVDGPFSSFNGVINEIDEDKKRVKVIVKIFGRETPLELNFLQIDKM